MDPLLQAMYTHHLPLEQLSSCPVRLNMVVKQLKSDTNSFLGRLGFLDLAVVNFIVSNANCQRYGETPWKEVVNEY